MSQFEFCPSGLPLSASGLSERNHFSTSGEEVADSVEALAPESSSLGGGAAGAPLLHYRGRLALKFT